MVDLGAAPFIISCALAYMEYKDIAVDYNPEKYLAIVSTCGIKVVKAFLKETSLNCPVEAWIAQFLRRC